MRGIRVRAGGWRLLVAVLGLALLGLSGLGALAAAQEVAPVYKESQLLSERYGHVWTSNVCGSRVAFVPGTLIGTDMIGLEPVPLKNPGPVQKLWSALKERHGDDATKYVHRIGLYWRDGELILAALVKPGAPDSLVRDLQSLLPKTAEGLGASKSMVVILDLVPEHAPSPSPSAMKALKNPYTAEKIDKRLANLGYVKDLNLVLVNVNARDPDTAFRLVGKLLDQTGLCGVPVLASEIPSGKPLPLTMSDNGGSNTQSGHQAEAQAAHAPADSADAASSSSASGTAQSELLLGSLSLVTGVVLVLLAYLRG